MVDIIRRSPVVFNAKPVNKEKRGHWTVVTEYENQGEGPYLVDLSHCPRWDVQDANISAIEPAGVAVPDAPNTCGLENGILINRMNRTQAAVWHLAGQEAEIPAEPAFTDTTDTTLFMALIGKDVFAITEKLTAQDLSDPSRTAPFLVQGPMSHVPCQIVVLDNSAGHNGVLFTCSRGYGKDMTNAVLHAGEAFGLKPAGENVFSEWLKDLTS
jgi:hypothetical protein